MWYDREMLISLDQSRQKAQNKAITFTRTELQAIVSLYSTHVAKGVWRDYALDFTRQMAVFSIFRHSNEQPQVAIVKLPGNTATGSIFEVLVERKPLSRTPFLDKALAALYADLAE